MLRSMGRAVAPLVTLFATFLATSAWAVPPALYTQPAYESPVRGDPDELLLLSGSGLSGADTVVYMGITNPQAPPPHPEEIPSLTSSRRGVIDIINAADTPYALTVHLPAAMDVDRTYAIWVVNPAGEWSAPAIINDARPLWITPDSTYQTASLAGLPRVLKVVGRNLQPGQTSNFTQVRLVGVNTGTTYVLTANNTVNDQTNTTVSLERYVAAVNLPSPLVVDHYTVAASRDGTNWIPLLGNGQGPAQTFAVNPDPTAGQSFAVGDYSDPITHVKCAPDDAVDDTGCIILALRDAQLAGGTVTFGPGTWLMDDAGTWAGQAYSNRTGWQAGYCPNRAETCGVTYWGVALPPGVSIQGAGSNATVIERGVHWPLMTPIFVFMGHNTISGFDFKDDNNYLNNYANQTYGGTLVQLGAVWYQAWMLGTSDPLTVSNVTITNNIFDKPWVAIGNRGLPVDHIYITHNVFGGAFNTAIGVGQDENSVVDLGPNPWNFPYQPYHWDDTVVDYNTFYPSSLQVTAAAYNSGAPGGNGSIATGFDTGRRADFSNNIADGTSTQYFYNSTDPKGFRAAFFWSMGASQEMTLVSSNTVSCSGDKYGDGESIVYDGSGTRGGTPGAEPVIATIPWTNAGIAGSSLTAQGVLVTQFPYTVYGGGTIDVSANPTPYYQGGFWVQVVSGAGKGQWRRVVSASVGSNSNGATFTVDVTPAFDVPPDATSQVVVARSYWQNTTVNNYIDQRTPLCTKANARDSGGTVSWYATTADSAMEGNQQYGTSGILLNHAYEPQRPGTTPVAPGGFAFQSYNEVRNNVVSGAYDWSSAGRGGGIELGFGATGWYCNNETCPAAPPVPTGFGVSVAGNTVSQASARDADGSVHPPIGGIGLNPGWTTGVKDPLGLAMWELDDDTLVFRNTLQDISNTVGGSAGGLPLVGIGIDVAQGSTFNPPINWRATLYHNSCVNVDKPLADFGLSTTRYCPYGNDGSCECAGAVSDDVGVTATGSPGSVTAGAGVTYTVTVANTDPAQTASDVTLGVEPPAGLQITGTTFAPSQGTCDAAVNICMLGSIPSGASATVTVTAVARTSGTWPMTFTVTHHEGDPNPANDGSVVTTTVQ